MKLRTSWKPRKLKGADQESTITVKESPKISRHSRRRKTTNFLTLFMPIYDLKCTCFGLHYISNTFGGSGSVWRLSCLLHFQLPVRFVLFGQHWALSVSRKLCWIKLPNRLSQIFPTDVVLGGVQPWAKAFALSLSLQMCCPISIQNNNKAKLVFAFNILHLDLGTIMNQKRGKGQELRVVDIFLHANE